MDKNKTVLLLPKRPLCDLRSADGQDMFRRKRQTLTRNLESYFAEVRWGRDGVLRKRLVSAPQNKYSWLVIEYSTATRHLYRHSGSYKCHRVHVNQERQSFITKHICHCEKHRVTYSCVSKYLDIDGFFNGL